VGYLVSIVGALFVGAFGLTWWKYVIPLNMRVLFGYPACLECEVPRTFVWTRNFGAAFSAVAVSLILISLLAHLVAAVL
jgi:hypothetical protein